MRRPSRGGGHGEEHVPWASFADALTGLLFVFILLTVMFVFAAQQAKKEAKLAKDAANKERASLLAADQRARAMVDASNRSSFVACLQRELPSLSGQVQLIPGKGADASTLSILIEGVGPERPTSGLTVGWFDTADAELKGDACAVTKKVGSCLQSILKQARDSATAVDASASRAARATGQPILEPGDMLRVFVEGHTDNQDMRDIRKYPSNWELSGARAAAVVRALTVGRDPRAQAKCEVDEEVVKSVQRAMSGVEDGSGSDRSPMRLQLIAVGRADQAPARAVVCEQVGVDEDDVCACMAKSSEAERNTCERKALEGKDGETHQERLINWANKSSDRQRSMRRVDLRFEVRPSLVEGSNAR